MEKTVKQRLMEFAEFRNLSISKFESLCGLGNGYVGKLKGEPGSRKLEDILKAFPELNRVWLLFGEGEMLKSTPAVQQLNTYGDNNYNNGVMQIGPAFGGFPAVTATEVTADGVEVLKCPKCHTMIDVTSLALVPVIPSEIMKTPDIDMAVYIKKHPDKLSEINLAQLWGAGAIAVEVDTRAMEPAYKEGTFVVIRQLPDLSYARADGTEYVIDAMRPHALLRYLTKERDGNYVLTAENEKKSPIYLKAEEIFGVWDIVGSFRLGR